MAEHPSGAAIQQEITRRRQRGELYECDRDSRKDYWCSAVKRVDVTAWCSACLLRASPSPSKGLEALVAEIRERQRQNEESRVWACQCESRWHADEYRDWADRLESALRAPAARSGGE